MFSGAHLSFRTCSEKFGPVATYLCRNAISCELCLFARLPATIKNEVPMDNRALCTCVVQEAHVEMPKFKSSDKDLAKLEFMNRACRQLGNNILKIVA